MTKEQFEKAIDKGLINLSALAKELGITNPTMYSKAKSKNFKQIEEDKLVQLGFLNPNNLMKEWGDKVREEFMTAKKYDVPSMFLDDTIYDLEFEKFKKYAEL
jgi:hypothetical protein